MNATLAHAHDWTHHQPTTCGGKQVWTCPCGLYATQDPLPQSGPVLLFRAGASGVVTHFSVYPDGRVTRHTA